MRPSSSATTRTSRRASYGCTISSCCPPGAATVSGVRSSPRSPEKRRGAAWRASSGACGTATTVRSASIAVSAHASATHASSRCAVARLPRSPPADDRLLIRLFVNGTVLTMDASLPVAQALAVKNGRIVEVGGTDEVLWLRDGEYELIDLEGRTVVPGFVDPHNHFSIGAFETLWADSREARSVADAQEALVAAARATPGGAWVRAVGYDHHLIGVHPTRGDLDAAVSDRPAVLMHFSHHQCVANSRALAEAGITRGTPDPEGGEIARDKTGEPTGLLFERAMSRVETASREAWE